MERDGRWTLGFGMSDWMDNGGIGVRICAAACKSCFFLEGISPEMSSVTGILDIDTR